jgi:DNA-binding response OmpR family regulator
MRRLLLIEPDYVLGQIYKEFFSRQGCVVDLANTAQSAVQLADDSKPDVVVLELQLVEHSGIEFLYEFRSYTDWADIPVIINTHVPASEFKDSWRILTDELVVKNYLYKPQTTLKDLLDQIDNVNSENLNEATSN